MTRAPDVSPLHFSDLAEAIAEMRRRGLRLSAPRRLVLQALFVADGPCSAEHLSRGLDLDLASVYRNLETLERHGLVRHVHLGHGPGLYALVGHGDQEYLYCEACGVVLSVAPEELDVLRETLHERFGYLARFTHHAIVGTCAACAGAKEDSELHTSTPLREAGSPHMHPHADHEHEHSHGDYVHSHADLHAREHQATSIGRAR